MSRKQQEKSTHNKQEQEIYKGNVMILKHVGAMLLGLALACLMSDSFARDEMQAVELRAEMALLKKKMATIETALDLLITSSSIDASMNGSDIKGSVDHSLSAKSLPGRVAIPISIPYPPPIPVPVPSPAPQPSQANSNDSITFHERVTFKESGVTLLTVDNNKVTVGDNVTLKASKIDLGFNVGNETQAVFKEDDKENNKSKTLMPTGNSICFLTSVEFAELEYDSRYAKCLVKQSDGNWVLEAYAYDTWRGARAICKARCLSWN